MRRGMAAIKYIVYGIIALLLLFIVLAGTGYAKAYMDTKSIINHGIQTVEKLSYNGLDQLQDDLERLQSEKDEMTLFSGYSKIKDIANQTKEREEELNKKYKSKIEKSRELLELNLEAYQIELIDTENITIQNREELENYINYFTESFVEIDLNLNDYNDLLKELEQKNVILTTQVDTTQKKILFESLIEMEAEAEELAAFFEKRGMEQQQEDMNQFLSKAKDIRVLQKYQEKNYKEIVSVLEDHVYPILNKSREEQQKTYDKEIAQREVWIEQEAKKWIGKLPPKAPKEGIWKQIYINIWSQKMYLYEDEQLIFSTYITSGKLSTPTVRGSFSIYQKTPGRYLSGDGYRLWVDYWMPFYGGYGIHDSCNSVDCWRSKFGGDDYKWGGSHGCINTPHSAVEFVYKWADIGTLVYVD